MPTRNGIAGAALYDYELDPTVQEPWIESADPAFRDWGADDLFARRRKRRMTNSSQLKDLEFDFSLVSKSRLRLAPSNGESLASVSPVAAKSNVLTVVPDVPGVEEGRTGDNLVQSPIASMQEAEVIPLREKGRGSVAASSATSITSRPTIQITGRPYKEASFSASRERQRRRPSRAERVVARPDRIAAWAFALGVLLIVVAITSAQAGIS